MMNKLEIHAEFISICKQILNKNLDLKAWALIESDDQFQMGPYCGGFDGTENEFTFSYFDENKNEFWFQLPLSDIENVVKGLIKEVDIRRAG